MIKILLKIILFCTITLYASDTQIKTKKQNDVANIIYSEIAVAVHSLWMAKYPDAYVGLSLIVLPLGNIFMDKDVLPPSFYYPFTALSIYNDYEYHNNKSRDTNKVAIQNFIALNLLGTVNYYINKYNDNKNISILINKQNNNYMLAMNYKY